MQRDGKIGGEGRFADPALAAAHRDDGERLLLRRHRDADRGYPLAREQGVAQPVLERLPLGLGEAGDVEDDRERPRVVEEAQAGRSEEHTSELQSLMRNSYAVVCVKKNKGTEDKKRDQRK